jgi:electron transfer flavoprotein alpha subunit
VLAVNDNPQAPIFDAADIGIVAPWQEVVPLLVAAVRAHRPVERRAV